MPSVFFVILKSLLCEFALKLIKDANYQKDVINREKKDYNILTNLNFS